ncbi:hypothetical protein IHQ71_24360 [Rhizobium sp. TH2]|uniref:hypothetical protein n=1 Tax=Rhizobium sp. TH2 TaxID=2775403 RepID=UPI0021572063|nr:hypothetical protein [Rhizobium sp. TH2]UVC08250.1 hypothetical protein IHQ71_24360 [Rhizobium sp. TH2]
MLAVRHDLRGTTLAVAGSIMLGWLSALPSVVEQGFDFPGDGKVAPAIFVMSPSCDRSCNACMAQRLSDRGRPHR